LLKLSYADTIIEDIEKLVPEALAKNGNTGVVVRCRDCQENNVHVETQQQRIEAVESQQYGNTFWLRVICFFVFCCFICLLYIIFLLQNKN